MGTDRILFHQYKCPAKYKKIYSLQWMIGAHTTLTPKWERIQYMFESILKTAEISEFVFFNSNYSNYMLFIDSICRLILCKHLVTTFFFHQIVKRLTKSVDKCKHFFSCRSRTTHFSHCLVHFQRCWNAYTASHMCKCSNVCMLQINK